MGLTLSYVTICGTKKPGKGSNNECPILWFVSVCPFALDLAFLLDSSGSIGEVNYQDMKRFINDVIEHFHVSPEGKISKK